MAKPIKSEGYMFILDYGITLEEYYSEYEPSPYMLEKKCHVEDKILNIGGLFE